ncbi:MAG: hypothetical protein C0168_00090 [Candidatus Aminicenantes bacterium]|nr:MAG: hypothetical protein C0168_00090 [Candidatus Aminicenantes bacterium]
MSTGIIIIGYFIFYYVILKRKQLILDKFTLAFLFLFSVSYVTISIKYNFISSYEAYRIFLIPSFFYLIGLNIIKDNQIKSTTIFFYSNILIISLFLFGFFSVAKSYYEYGLTDLFMNTEQRVVLIPWSDISLNATNIIGYFCMSLSLVGIIFFGKRKKSFIVFKIFYLIIFLISILSIILLGSRTGLIIFLISFIATFIVYIFYGPPKKEIKLIKIIFIIIFIILLAYAISANMYGIGNKLFGSTLSVRLYKIGIAHDLRYKAWEGSLLGLLDYPFGGKRSNIPLNYAHNLWLDVGYTAGIIPFILIIIFSLSTLKSYLTIIKTKIIDVNIKLLLTGIYISLFSYFFVEPILEGSFILFTIFCFISGMTKMYSNLSVSATKKMVRKVYENTLVR